VLPQHTSKAVLQKSQDLENLPCDSADDTHSDDEDVVTACDEFTRQSLLQRCATSSRNSSPHYFKSEPKTQCTQCFKSWTPQGIQIQGDELKTVHGKTPIRLLGIPHNMWFHAKSQRRKVIDTAIEVAAYLYKNDNLRIGQRLKVISMCLPSLFLLLSATHRLAKIRPQAPHSRMGQSIQERLEPREKYGDLSRHLSQGQEWTSGQAPARHTFHVGMRQP